MGARDWIQHRALEGRPIKSAIRPKLGAAAMYPNTPTSFPLSTNAFSPTMPKYGTSRADYPWSDTYQTIDHWAYKYRPACYYMNIMHLALVLDIKLFLLIDTYHGTRQPPGAVRPEVPWYAHWRLGLGTASAAPTGSSLLEYRPPTPRSSRAWDHQLVNLWASRSGMESLEAPLWKTGRLALFRDTMMYKDAMAG